MEQLLNKIKEEGFFPSISIIEDANGSPIWRSQINYGPTIYDCSLGYDSISPLVALEKAYNGLLESQK
ncbi:MAG: hypothetical protein M0R80_04005 [Proteobacteria bacterium]|jgi:hypothetical protein|nr:hypothetical protein [Pseudomonadota bacterium]